MTSNNAQIPESTGQNKDNTGRAPKRALSQGETTGQTSESTGQIPKRTRFNIAGALSAIADAENAPVESGVNNHKKKRFNNNKRANSSLFVHDSDEETEEDTAPAATGPVGPTAAVTNPLASTPDDAPITLGATTAEADAAGMVNLGSANSSSTDSSEATRASDKEFQVTAEDKIKEEENDQADEELFETLANPFAAVGAAKKLVAAGNLPVLRKNDPALPAKLIEHLPDGGIRKRVVINPDSPAQRVRKPLSPQAEALLKKECNWLFFLHLHHDVHGAKEEIMGRVAPQFSMAHTPIDYEDLYREIIRLVNNKRQPLVTRIIRHVKDMLIQDKKEGGNLVHEKSHKNLAKWFYDRYSHQNFVDVFTFIAPFVILHDSSSLAIYYTQSLYANLCGKIKLHHDWICENHDAERPNMSHTDSSAGVNQYLKEFPKAKQFANVSRGEFAEQNGVRMGKVFAKKEEFIVTDNDRHFENAPPPPKARYMKNLECGTPAPATPANAARSAAGVAANATMSAPTPRGGGRGGARAQAVLSSGGAQAVALGRAMRPAGTRGGRAHAASSVTSNAGVNSAGARGNAAVSRGNIRMTRPGQASDLLGGYRQNAPTALSTHPLDGSGGAASYLGNVGRGGSASYTGNGARGAASGGNYSSPYGGGPHTGNGANGANQGGSRRS